MAAQDDGVAIGEPGAAAAGRVSHAIFRVARLHRMLAGLLLRRTGLYPGQELVMMHLWDVGPQRQADLVKVLDSDAATMTRTVQRLERAGFVRRTPSPTDRRAVIVESTPAGHALRSQVERIWQDLEDLTTDALDPDRREQLLELLTAVERTLIGAVEGTHAETA
jgi:DNA-binding MarR family transcriptional regulator